MNQETTIGALVAEKPQRAKVFEQFGIDYCCGGKRSLREACQEKSVDPELIVGMLESSDAPTAEEKRYTDVSSLTLTELVDHLESVHHSYLRRELPRLLLLSQKVAAAHGGKDERLKELEEILLSFSNEIGDHLAKEEMVLFPTIRQMEAGEEMQLHCGIMAPIQQMEFEHDSAGAALKEFRRLTDNLTVPEFGCGTLAALYEGLRDLEADLHQHVHKENNILFPKSLTQLSAIS